MFVRIHYKHGSTHGMGLLIYLCSIRCAALVRALLASPTSLIPDGSSTSTTTLPTGTSILSVVHHDLSFLHASFEQDVLRGQGGSLYKYDIRI